MNSTIRKNERGRFGFTMVEALVYAAGLALIAGAAASFLYYSYGWYDYVSTGPRADQTGLGLVSMMDSDFRAANAVNATDSIFGNPVGAVSVTQTEGTVSTTTRYWLSGGRLWRAENGGLGAAVSPADLTVSSFTAYAIDTSAAEAVRFELDMTYADRQGTTTRAYSGLAILRQSYK